MKQTQEKELKQFVETHGYVWIGLKRFENHDRIAVKHVKSGVKVELSLTKHIEDFPLEHAKQWFPMEQ